MVNRDHSLWEGGDRQQIEYTIRALKNLGINAEYSSNTAIQYDADIVHLFHMSYTTAYKAYLNARRQGLPLVVSSVYSDYNISILKQQAIIDYAAKVVFLSEGERHYVSLRVNIDTSKIEYVENGVSHLFDSLVGPGRYVLCVGRVQRKKNQLLLSRACRFLGLPCICVGQIMEKEYAHEVHKEGAKLIGNISHSDLVSYYRNAQVVACVSDHEIQPLCVLEGGLSGANILLTINSLTFTSGYPNIWTCEPELEPIVNMLRKAWYTPKNANLKYIFQKWTWDRVALKLNRIYNDVI